MKNWKINEECYIIVNNKFVHNATVVGISGEFYTVRFESTKVISVRESRLYKTKQEAEKAANIKPDLSKIIHFNH